jgi:AraC-like DNA-binding protein
VLSRYVAEIRIVVHDGSDSNFIGLPQAQARLVLRLMDVGSRSGPIISTHGLHALAIRTGAVYKSLAHDRVSLIVRFHPGCAQLFFQMPMCDLADRLVPIQELWGSEGSRLQDKLVTELDSCRWVELVEAALSARIRNVEETLHEPSRIAHAVATVVQDDRISTIRELSDRLGLSERQLRRSFAVSVGIAPKQFMRIVRLHRALRAASSDGAQLRWSSVATAAGYYDQAHFISECRRLTGMTPSAFFREWRLTGKHREPLL